MLFLNLALDSIELVLGKLQITPTLAFYMLNSFLFATILLLMHFDERGDEDEK